MTKRINGGWHRSSRNTRITQRQFEVLYWIAEGKHAEEIATILNISRRTVYEHCRNAMKSLDCVTVIQAAVKALKVTVQREFQPNIVLFWLDEGDIEWTYEKEIK